MCVSFICIDVNFYADGSLVQRAAEEVGRLGRVSAFRVPLL